MTLRSATRSAIPLMLLAVMGCYFPVRAKIDAAVCDIAKQPFDLQHLEAADQKPLMPPAENGSVTPTAYPSEEEETSTEAQPSDRGPVQPGQRYDPFKDLEKYRRPTLQVPPDLLPNGPPPPFKPGELDTSQRRERLRREFQPLRPPGPDYEGVPGPFGHPLTLSELQRIGLSSSPLIKQAVAAVEVARGNAFQAGLPPNPVIGFEDDTFGTTGGAGYPGGFIDQLIVTGGKLQLRRAVFAMDLRNAEVALRRAQMDLATRIRTFYFQLLVARENMRVNRILVAFANTVYEFQAGQARSKAELTIAAYEPMYLRALANIASVNLVTARNSYTQAWKQLVATLGLPGMPLTQVAGRVDMPVPVFDFAKVWAHVGRNNTDVATADISLQQARFALLLAQVLQTIPDVNARILIQKDFTGPPNAIAPSLAVYLPMPLWNRNQGGVAAAQANVIQMGEEPLRVRNDLYTRLSEAFQRYQTNRKNLAIYRDEILPDLVRVYDAIYQRYQIEGQVNLPPPPAGVPAAIQINPPTINDVVVAQQLLTSNIANYVTALGLMWQAVVDVTDLIQTNDMFRLGEEVMPTEAVPVLPDLLPTHPCSPLPDPQLRRGDGSWPEAIPTRHNYPMPKADGEVRRPQPTPAALATAVGSGQ